MRSFVRSLAEQLALRGAEVGVVAPRPHWRPTPGELTSSVEAPIPLLIRRPGYFSFSNRVIAPGFSTFRWTVASFSRALDRGARELPFTPDVAYGHFLFPSGYAVLRHARSRGFPAVAAVGESDLGYYDRQLGRQKTSERIRGFAGLLAVSSENRDYCVEHLGVQRERIRVIPNAADTKRFYPRDRAEMRAKLGLPQDRPIVVFSGLFSHRKGAQRLLAAIRESPEIGSIFLGSGPDQPEGEQVLFADKVPHADVPDWLSAADLFALPTLAEGSPNAVIEAMACGLPIISSDIPALHETVDPECAVLVDPLDEAALRRAIADLARDPARRQKMSEAALARAERFTLSQRAERILEWLHEIVDRERPATPEHAQLAGGRID